MSDCESGPREILSDGTYGRLVPCNDPSALATAIENALDHPHDPTSGRARAKMLSGQESIDRHLATMLG